MGLGGELVALAVGARAWGYVINAFLINPISINNHVKRSCKQSKRTESWTAEKNLYLRI
jgi:hypothetical protein